MYSIKGSSFIFTSASCIGIFSFYNKESGKLAHKAVYKSVLVLFLFLLYGAYLYEVGYKIGLGWILRMVNAILIFVAITSSFSYSPIFYKHYDIIMDTLIKHHGIVLDSIKYSGAKFALLLIYSSVHYILRLYVSLKILGNFMWTSAVIDAVELVYLVTIYSLEFVFLTSIINIIKGIDQAVDFKYEALIIKRKLHSLTRLHWLVGEIVVLYNGYVGYVFLSQILSFFVATVSMTQYILTLNYVPLNGEAEVILVNLTMVMNISIYFGLLLILLSTSSTLNFEFYLLSRKAEGLLYKYIGKKWLVDKLKTFVDQTKSYPEISAAGFFVLDWTLTVTLLGLITTFVVLVVEDIKKNSYH